MADAAAADVSVTAAVVSVAVSDFEVHATSAMNAVNDARWVKRIMGFSVGDI
jgi:hypothetical protein